MFQEDLEFNITRTHAPGYSFQKPILLTWINFNPSMDK